MGQQSSTPGTSPTLDTALKRDYYTILRVPPSATDAELRTSYRKLALELHPDRNYNDTERATALFAEVQSAYEILSDPQERAWYDSHRDQILRGDDVGSGSARRANEDVLTTPDVLKWFSGFSARMSYDDADDNGFYAVVGKAFARLAEEEVEAAEWDDEEPVHWPSFGTAKSSYESGDVKEFYAAWIGFSTAKTFSWEDLYRYADAPDRRIKRLMEKENNKLRDAARREFSETVRQFVTFVRKRDPRYTPNSETAEQRQQKMRKMAQEQAQRQRAENAKAKTRDVYETPEWAKPEEEGPEVDEWPSDEMEEDSEEEEELERFECIVCRKKFGSTGQMEQHEKSKKHKQAVEKLKRQMKKENKEFDLERDVRGREKAPSEDSVASEDEDDEAGEPDASFTPFDAAAEEIIARAEIMAELNSYRHDTDTVQNTAPPSRRSSEGSADIPISKLSLSTPTTSPPSTPKHRKSDLNSSPSYSSEDSDVPASTFISRLTTTTPSEPEPEPAKPRKTAKAKREKRAAAAAVVKAEQEEDAQIMCATCQEIFPSRTRLFAHLKNWTEHEAAVGVGGAWKAKTGKRGKRQWMR